MKQAKILLFTVICMLMVIPQAISGLDGTHSSIPYSTYANNELIIAGDGIPTEIAFTVKELESMSSGWYSGYYTMRTLVEPHTNSYSGIRLDYLFGQAGVLSEAKSVTVSAADGVSMTFNIDELTAANYINENGGSQLPVILAYAKDNKPMIPDKTSTGYDKEVDNSGGPLRLVIGQTVSGERNSPKWLQNVVKITISKSTAAESFSDLGTFYSWAEEAIYSLADKRILSGVGSGKFAPEKNVTRAEFTKMILNALEIETVKIPVGIFSDVQKTGWAAPYIEAAVKEQLIKGIGEGKFGPEGAINRNEIACLMARAMSWSDSGMATTSQSPDYKDKERIPVWAADSVAVCEEKGLFENIAVGYFNGTTSIKRAEAAVIIYRMLEL